MFCILLLSERRLRGLGGGRYWERPWVARVGPCAKHGLDREFIGYQRDYRKASGFMGRELCFFLRSGYYEVKEVLSARRIRRYFIRVDQGRARECQKEEIVKFNAAFGSPD